MCFAPTSLDPRSLRQQLFGSVLIRFPAVVYKLTLLLQLFTNPSSCHVQDATPGPQIEKALSVHIGPSVAEPGNSAPGHRWALPFPPAPPWRAVPSVFPQLSVGALDHYEYPHHHCPPPQAVNAGMCLSPERSIPGPLYLLCLLPGLFPQIVSGLLCLPI